MQIKLDEKFEINFNIIFEYIAKDKLSASKKFKKGLFDKIKYLPNFPHKFKKSFYFDDEKVRDMTFKITPQ
jgi:plasmid stabilization system protein ParE